MLFLCATELQENKGASVGRQIALNSARTEQSIKRMRFGDLFSDSRDIYKNDVSLSLCSAAQTQSINVSSLILWF